MRDLAEINVYGDAYIKSFFQTCTVEEKIAGHKFSVKIINPTTFKFFKNGKLITQDHIILNKIWKTLISDWTTYLIGNDWTKRHVGFTIKGFYLPTLKPFSTEYKQGCPKYIINTIVNFKDKEQPLTIMPPNPMFEAQRKYTLKDYDLQTTDYMHLSDKISKSLGNDERVSLYSDSPAGWVLKGKKHMFKIDLVENVHYESNKLPLEMVMIDFIDHIKNRKDWPDLITSNYSSSVCNLFEDYVLSKDFKVEARFGISPEDLEAPYYGSYEGMSYDYIPNETTKCLCKKSKMYEAVFKVLLANLRRPRGTSIILTNDKLKTLNLVIKALNIKTKVV